MSPRRRLVFAVVVVVLAVAGVVFWRWWGSEPIRADRAAGALADFDGVTATSVSVEPVDTRVLRVDLADDITDAASVDAVTEASCTMIREELFEAARIHRAAVAIDLRRWCARDGDDLADVLVDFPSVPGTSTVISAGEVVLHAAPSADPAPAVAQARLALRALLSVDAYQRVNLDLTQVRYEHVDGEDGRPETMISLSSASAEMDAALEALADVEPELTSIEIDGRLVMLTTDQDTDPDLDRLGRVAGTAAAALDEKEGSYILEMRGSDRRLTGTAGSDPGEATALSRTLRDAGWGVQRVNADRTELVVTTGDHHGGVRVDLTGLTDTLDAVDPPVPEDARIEVVSEEQIFGGTPADLARVSRDREPLIEEGYGVAWATNTEQSPWDASIGIVMPEGQSLLDPGERLAAFEAARSLTWDGTAEVRIWEDAGDDTTRTRGVRIISTDTGPAQEISSPGEEAPIEERTARESWDVTARE